MDFINKTYKNRLTGDSFTIIDQYQNVAITSNKEKINTVLLQNDKLFIDNNPHITGLKILNIVSHNYLYLNIINGPCYTYTRYEIDNINYLAIENEDFSKIPNKLECTWWFEYYITKAFGCGAGRLVQYSGTCYLNAVVNAIILSANFRNIFITHMKRQLRDDPILHSYVKKDIYELACSLKEPNELAYIYRIIYNIFCKQKEPATLTRSIDKKDLFIHASKRYFSDKDEPSDKEYGEGGFSKSTLYDIISKSGISFTVYLPNSKRFMIKNRETNIQHIRQLSKFMPLYTEITNKQDADNDLIIYINETFSYQEITDTLLFNNINFELECCTITFWVVIESGVDPTNPAVKLPNTQSGHSIVGYKCDGYNKIYDSSANKIANIDWQRIDNPTIMLQLQSILEKWWLNKKIIKIFNIHIDTAIYVNKYKSDFFSYTGSC